MQCRTILWPGFFVLVAVVFGGGCQELLDGENQNATSGFLQQGSDGARGKAASRPPADVAESVEVADEAIQPHVVIGHDGRICLTMIRQGNICVVLSDDRVQSFSEPVVAIDVGGRARGGMHRGPRIGVDDKGVLTVTAPVTFDPAEYEKKYPTAELYMVRSTDGGVSWSQPVQVNEVAKQAPEALHWMTVASDGVVHIAWLDRRSRTGAGQDIYYATVVDGTVGENVKVAETVCECCAPGLAVDASGNPLLAFREGGIKDSREIFARWSQNGGRSFGDVVRINTTETKEDGCPMSAPAVAVSGAATTFAAAWKDVRTGEPNVYWTISDKPEFTEGELVHSEIKGKQDHPTLCIDSRGFVWVAWEDSRDGEQEIRIRSTRERDTERLLSNPADGKASFPSIATHDGLTVVAYETQQDGRKAVRLKVVAMGE